MPGAQDLGRVTDSQTERIEERLIYVVDWRAKQSAPGRNRTCDRQLRRLPLCPLSYGGLPRILAQLGSPRQEPLREFLTHPLQGVDLHTPHPHLPMQV
jgi:hypothetical protein